MVSFEFFRVIGHEVSYISWWVLLLEYDVTNVGAQCRACKLTIFVWARSAISCIFIMDLCQGCPWPLHRVQNRYPQYLQFSIESEGLIAWNKNQCWCINNLSLLIQLDVDYLIKQQWPLLFIIPTSVSSFSKEALKQLGWGIRPSRTCSEPLKQSTCSWENLVGVYYFALVKLCFTANLLLPGQPNLPHMEPIIFPAWTQQVLC